MIRVRLRMPASSLIGGGCKREFWLQCYFLTEISCQSYKGEKLNYRGTSGVIDIIN